MRLIPPMFLYLSPTLTAYSQAGVEKENSLTLYTTLSWSNKVFARAACLLFHFSHFFFFFHISFCLIVLVVFSVSLSNSQNPMGGRIFLWQPKCVAVVNVQCNWCDLWRECQLAMKPLMSMSMCAFKVCISFLPSHYLCVCVCFPVCVIISIARK